MGEASNDLAVYRDSPEIASVDFQPKKVNVVRIAIVFRVASFKLFGVLRIFRPGVEGQNGGSK